MKRTLCIEFLIITLVGLSYFTFLGPTPAPGDVSSSALDLRPATRLLNDTSIRPIGVEHERLAGAILPYRFGLERYHHLPSWNPYLSNGVPLLNNAFSYLLNPFHSLPVLLLDPITGSKLAILIALLIAGYNMWLLGYVIGLGAVARVTIASLYLVNGSMSAKFGAGHFQLACSLAWLPLVIAALWWMLHTQRRIAPVAFGISFALLFYAGNIYYALHTLVGCAVIVAIHLIVRVDSRWRFRRDQFLRAVLAAAFAFGLSAVQFFPVWLTRDAVTHDQQEIKEDGTLANNYDFAQAAANLTQNWNTWVYSHPPYLFDAVDYAHIGMLPFVLIALGLIQQITYRLRQKQWQQSPYARLLYAAVPLALVMMIWAGGQLQPIPWLYKQIPLLTEFRYLGRALAVAGFWWILLGGIALDGLWKCLAGYLQSSPQPLRHIQASLMWIAVVVLALWLFLFIYSASPSATRITLMLRNIAWWQLMDTIRFPSLQTALYSFVHLFIATALIAALVRVMRRLLPLPNKVSLAWSELIISFAQLGLLALIAFGVLDAMVGNSPSLRFVRMTPAFTPIYADIRQIEGDTPFSTVSLPFSPLTFDAPENQIRIWSLSEGWLPSAPRSPVLTMGYFTNFPRWLIAERSTNGSIHNPTVQAFADSAGYQRRACYAQAQTTERMPDCFAARMGFDLYELPDALPYAFVVTERDLTNNPTTLRRTHVTPAAVASYQQDSLTLSVTTESSLPQFLVIQEANFPGWQVTVDGTAIQSVTVPTLNTDSQILGLLAVPIAAGSHFIVATFTPPGLTLGIIVFIVTLALIALYLTYHPKQKSPA